MNSCFCFLVFSKHGCLSRFDAGLIHSWVCLRSLCQDTDCVASAGVVPVPAITGATSEVQGRRGAGFSIVSEGGVNTIVSRFQTDPLSSLRGRWMLTTCPPPLLSRQGVQQLFAWIWQTICFFFAENLCSFPLYDILICRGVMLFLAVCYCAHLLSLVGRSVGPICP